MRLGVVFSAFFSRPVSDTWFWRLRGSKKSVFEGPETLIFDDCFTILTHFEIFKKRLQSQFWEDSGAVFGAFFGPCWGKLGCQEPKIATCRTFENRPSFQEPIRTPPSPPVQRLCGEFRFKAWAAPALKTVPQALYFQAYALQASLGSLSDPGLLQKAWVFELWAQNQPQGHNIKGDYACLLNWCVSIDLMLVS